MINPEALKAAANALNRALLEEEGMCDPSKVPLLPDSLETPYIDQGTTNLGNVARAAITAYLAALPPIEDGLVERLQSHMGKQDVSILLADCREAADTITRLVRELGEAREADSFLWRWIERGMYCPQTSAKSALNILAHHPSAPWNNGRWDVDHKSYAEAFYTAFPMARQALPAKGDEK